MVVLFAALAFLSACIFLVVLTMKILKDAEIRMVSVFTGSLTDQHLNYAWWGSGVAAGVFAALAILWPLIS